MNTLFNIIHVLLIRIHLLNVNISFAISWNKNEILYEICAHRRIKMKFALITEILLTNQRICDPR